MGFCEMIYHETRNFPESEKNGLGRELRETAMNLLSTITRESVKNQKEFLKSLDKTIDIQLDSLLLLKLAFRMSFIDQRVYQTLEEDLKGLEKIVNEMKDMHGITVSTESIFSDTHQNVTSEQAKTDQKEKESGSAKQPEKPKQQKPRRSQQGKKKHQPRSSQAIQHSKSDEPEPAEEKKEVSPEIKSEPESTVTRKMSSSIQDDSFRGTPLYDDNDEMELDSGMQTQETESTENKSESEPTPVLNDKKKKSRGRWTLKRSTSRKSP